MGGDGALETSRTSGIGLGAPLVLALGILLVAVAIGKPWASPTASPSRVPPPSAADAVSGRAADRVVQSAASGSADSLVSDPICPSSDGWRIVIDDLEFGHAVRTWLVPTEFYTSVSQPPLAPNDVATFVTTSVRQLAFCAAPESDGRPPRAWSGKLWYLASAASPDAKRLMGTLASMPNAFSAVVRAVGAAGWWPSGIYLLEAQLPSAAASVWVPVELTSRGG